MKRKTDTKKYALSSLLPVWCASYGSVIGIAAGGGATRVGFGIVIGVAAGAGRGAGATRTVGFGIVTGVAAGTAILSSPAGGSGWGLKADAG